MRVTIVGTLGTRAGRPSFKAMAGDSEGLVELDNSAAAKLGGNIAMGVAKLSEIDAARGIIEEAATRLYAAGCTTSPAGDGRWHLMLSALDLD